MVLNMVTVIKLSDTIQPQEYEKERDKVIKLLSKFEGDYSVSLSFLHDYLDLDENLLPAYVVGVWWMKALLIKEHSTT
jgi:hypothetical protein